MAYKDLKVQREYDRARSKEPRKRKKQTEIVRKRNIKTQGRRNHRKSWTEQEIAFLWRTDYTIQEIAVMLHRSYMSIVTARAKNVAKQPKHYRHNGNRRLEIEESVT